MQGASTVAVVFMLAAAVPAASSAQQAPGVGLPGAAQVPQAPVPPVTPPAVPAPSVPEVPAPSLPTRAAPLPSTLAPRIPAPNVPGVRLPEVRAPSSPAPPAQAAPAPGAPSADLLRLLTGESGSVGPGVARGASNGWIGADALGQPRAGSGAGGGAPGSSPGRARRAARAAARLRGGEGVLGTSFRTHRALVRALNGCIDRLPPRQDRLLTLPYGVGDAWPRPASAVADMLDLSRGRYAVVRRNALRGLVWAARTGACQAGRGGDASALPGHVVSGPGSLGRALRATAADSGSQHAAIGVPRQLSSGGEPWERERRRGFGIPACPRCGERAAW
jgi:hypothetical protein